MRIQRGDGEHLNDFLRASGQWNRSVGGSFDTYLKPFTTQTGVVYMPSYVVPNLNNSGVANASGLNPFGPHTLAEGIIWGTGMPASGFDIGMDPASARTFGFKNPANMVGWGYDQFGYPSPNANTSWKVSGYLSVTAPDDGFAALIPTGTSTDASGIMRKLGSHVPATGWQAGPLDLRFDSLRGVWTAPQSVYAARIYSSDVSGTLNSTSYAYSRDIRYTAEILDGTANQLRVTGIKQFGLKPEVDTYQVLPMASGEHCLLMHSFEGGRPLYGLLGWETPKLTSCNEPTNRSTEIIVRNEIPAVSGIDYENLQAGQFLRGNASGTFDNIWIGAGTGIYITSHATGFAINLVSGFFGTGVANPLPLAQGGTGASGMVFVAITGIQSVSGVKTWLSQAKFSSGTVAAPAITFGSTTNGFSYGVPSGIALSVYGSGIMYANTTGTYFTHAAEFTNVYNLANPSIRARQVPGYSDVLFQGIGSSNATAFEITTSGTTYFRTSGYIGVQAPTGLTTGYIVFLPTGGNLATTQYINSLPKATGMTIPVTFTTGVYSSGQTIVTGLPWITANTAICSTPYTTGNSLQVALLQFNPVVSDIVPTTGFTLSIYSPAQTTGVYNFKCVIVY